MAFGSTIAVYHVSAHALSDRLPTRCTHAEVHQCRLALLIRVALYAIYPHVTQGRLLSGYNSLMRAVILPDRWAYPNAGAECFSSRTRGRSPAPTAPLQNLVRSLPSMNVTAVAPDSSDFQSRGSAEIAPMGKHGRAQ